jgi:outer membrane biogenesis lipoprotein LolB
MLILLVFNLLTGCSINNSDKNVNGKDIRQIVWEQLSQEEQNEIIGNWKDGKIEEIIAEKDSRQFSLKDEELDGKEVYLITFKSKNEAVIGDVQKLVDIESNKIVGTSYRN